MATGTSEIAMQLEISGQTHDIDHGAGVPDCTFWDRRRIHLELHFIKR